MFNLGFRKIPAFGQKAFASANMPATPSLNIAENTADTSSLESPVLPGSKGESARDNQRAENCKWTEKSVMTREMRDCERSGRMTDTTNMMRVHAYKMWCI